MLQLRSNATFSTSLLLGSIGFDYFGIGLRAGFGCFFIGLAMDFLLGGCFDFGATLEFLRYYFEYFFHLSLVAV